MANFHYTALDAGGRVVSGELTAESAAEATAQLEGEGLRIERLQRLEPEQAEDHREIAASAESSPAARKETAQWLGDENFIETTERVAEITRSGLPLGPGLRALCEEMPRSPLRQALLHLSERLEAGESLESAVETTGVTLPRGLRAIIRAGLRSNRLGLLLERYLAYSRRALDERRQAVLALLYPGVLLAVSGAVLLFYLIWLIPSFESIFDDFGTAVPAATQALLWLSRFLRLHAIWVVMVVAASVIVAYLAVGRIWGPGRRRRVLHWIPVVGPLFSDAALAQYCGLLALLIDSRVPLPDSIEISGEASRDPAVAEDSRWMADGLRQGMRLDDAALMFSRMPAELRRAFRWEGRPDALSSSVRAAGEIFSARAQVRGGLMRVLISPLIVVGAGFLVLTIMGLLFMPLIGLLNNLS